jgi:D-alanyl-D-alanine carboxypeptidase (penicillin-binding protein 5/6)
MNIFAHQLGLKDTIFKNSTGWPDEGHLMSARDLAVLATRLVKDFPEYYHYHSIKQYSFNKVKQNNRNTLIGVYGVDGIKPGKTDIAGHGIVISAKKNGRRLIAVINGLKSEKERELEAKKILDFGFSNFKNLTLFKGQKEVVEADVIYGNLNQISLNVQSEIVITVPLEYDRMKNLLFLTKFKEPLEAPIKKGDVVGKLKIMDNKERILIKEVDLIASTDVEKSGVIKRVFQGIKYFFKKLIS